MSEEYLKTLFKDLPDESTNQSDFEKQRSSTVATAPLTTSTNQPPQSETPEISGYIHNLSPLKQGKFFDFHLQDRTVCGICFSPPKHKRFEEFSTAGSPVKIKKFKIDTKSNAEDYVMANDVCIEHCPDIDFEKN